MGVQELPFEPPRSVRHACGVRLGFVGGETPAKPLPVQPVAAATPRGEDHGGACARLPCWDCSVIKMRLTGKC
jgi:hypothetical protein